jgi:class 3 adenylate cyclase/predicted nucleic acid-binding Zn ribbon protein
MSDGVTCASCGATAGPGQRFCGTCGQALAVSCPTCGTANPPDHRFCGSCGSALAASAGGAGATAAPGPAGTATSFPPAATPTPGGNGAGAVSAPAFAPTVAERRLVSVLFADLVGFTPFAEERDAEDVRDTLTRYFDLASEIIRRYGGTVEKFIGDAVMAVWGTPTAREDDAERAVRAGIDLVDSVRSLGPTIQARAGILTGETAVTLGATNQGMVAGDLVNTAARLQSVAAPGTVLVGESTYRAASGAITFEAAGDQTLKGKAAPVPAWRAIRVVAERGGRGHAEQL